MPDKKIYYRLVALWVICEAMLGGIIHGLKLPVSGLIVGGTAVICICLMANYYPVRGSILKATIVVAIFKMMLSPQSPFPAYIAVFFQGLIAELIFMNRKFYRLSCILFCALALIESGIQRLLVMTIVFGMDIWKAFNIFISGITGQESVTNYSYYLALMYVLLHLIIGILIGWYVGLIPGKIKKFPAGSADLLTYDPELSKTSDAFPKKSKKRKFIFIVWLVVIAFFLHDIFDPSQALIPKNLLVKLLLRSVLIVLTWVVVINPLLTRLLHQWLEKKRDQAQNDIQEILLLLPSTQWLVQQSWNLSSRKKGFSRIRLFFKIVFLNSLIHG